MAIVEISSIRVPVGSDLMGYVATEIQPRPSEEKSVCHTKKAKNSL